MCGIAGQLRLDGRDVDAGLVERMCEAIRHRGPDSRGTEVAGEVGLGIQRLRVIDLETGDQPIFNEDRSVCVVLNGEIYNHVELRERLERAGHRFSTRSDTEVIAHLYEDEGAGCVRHLNGMFAFAVWDAKRRRLLLARDRIGKKPLYYALRRSALSFGSELSAVLEDAEIGREPDHAALDAYFAFGWVPGPRTAFEAIRKLPPAHTLTLEDGRARLERYWRLDYGRETGPTDAREAAEALREQLRRAVRRRLVADVPLGAFLSGGVDSSGVVAAMAEATSGSVRTFSIGFTSDGYDELPQARLVAQRFGTDHEELVVEPRAIDLLPRIVRHYGEPFADSSAIPSFYVAEMARRHVTVVLNGDGGDESFAGYTHYVSNLAAGRAQVVPRPLRRLAGAAGGKVPVSGRIDSWPSRVRRLSQTVGLEPRERYLAYQTHLNGLNRDHLYTPAYRELVGESIVADVIADPWEQSGATNLLDRMLAVDAQTYLPDDLLVKMDVATMAHSLEARSPLLDHELMQFAADLPPRLKLRGARKKVVLRAALRGWVPDAVLDAPKRGFRVPLADWLRGDLREHAREILLDREVAQRGWFDPTYVRGLLDDHDSAAADNSAAIWRLLAFELWQREVVARPPGVGAPAGTGTA